MSTAIRRDGIKPFDTHFRSATKETEKGYDDGDLIDAATADKKWPELGIVVLDVDLVAATET